MTTESSAGWAPPRPVRPRRPGRIVFWIIVGLVAAGIVGCLATMVLQYRSYKIDAGSMQNTLRIGGDIHVQLGHDVRRGDVIVYTVPGTGFQQASGPYAGRTIGPGVYVKRLIALPGDHVACCDAAGDVTVNGKALHEQAYLYPGSEPSVLPFSVTLGPGQMWVMGDHRLISLDSRGYGPVPTADITGRVFQVATGMSTVPVTVPETFVADGLAPPDHRNPMPEFTMLAVGATFLFVVLVVLSVFGIVRWALRRRRMRRDAMAFGQVT